MPWLLNVFYMMLAAAALPWLVVRKLRTGKGVAGWRVKLTGRAPNLDPAGARIWLHAVSVGEVLLLRRIIAELQRRYPKADLVITTTTATGFDVARKNYPHLTVCFFPFDFSWAVRGAIRRLKPTAILLVELEIWPNLLLAASAASIPVGIVNGRLSDKSFRGYSKIKPLVSHCLKHVRGIAAQNEPYAQRFGALGYPDDRITVTGSVKYDGLESNRDNPHTTELRQAFRIAEDDLVLIAGSTQAPEEAIALRMWRKLVIEHPRLRLILVPRHRERFEEVAKLVRAENLPLHRRSSDALPDSRFPTPDSRPILLLDTLGELAACWGLADIAFVGGSLTPRGGQNMIEPAAYGAPVLVGPNIQNFRETVGFLTRAKAIEIVEDETQLTEMVRRLLQDESRRLAMGQRARQTVQNHRGATEKTMEFLEEWLFIEKTDAPRAAA